MSEQNKYTKDMLLKDIVSSDFNTAAILEKHNLDFCCNGYRTLETACTQLNLNTEDVLSKLNNHAESSAQYDNRYDQWSIGFLAEYILNNHHVYVKNAIPRINALLEKITEKHSGNHPELIEVKKLYKLLSEDMLSHLAKEEEILFPIIKNLDAVNNGNGAYTQHGCGSIKNPIRVMDSEHDNAGELAYKIRSLTNNYTTPEDGCTSYDVALKELKQFEEDLHKHVHLETNILFPKSIEVEEAIM